MADVTKLWINALTCCVFQMEIFLITGDTFYFETCTWSDNIDRPTSLQFWFVAISTGVSTLAGKRDFCGKYLLDSSTRKSTLKRTWLLFVENNRESRCYGNVNYSHFHIFTCLTGGRKWASKVKSLVFKIQKIGTSIKIYRCKCNICRVCRYNSDVDLEIQFLFHAKKIIGNHVARQWTRGHARHCQVLRGGQTKMVRLKTRTYFDVSTVFDVER